MQVDVITLDDIVALVKRWIDEPVVLGRSVCVSNVHMCMETFDDKSFQSMVNGADLVIPDGKPLVFAQRLLGANDALQTRGADITSRLCSASALSNIPIAFYGGTESVLNDLERILAKTYPGINIVCKISPPFRPLTEIEEKAYIQKINDSDAKILFVGIGCPKQERWMAEHKASLSCVMLGVGAVFDFLSGNKREAPAWVRSLSLEWLFRLLCEPRRLWYRYFKQNPRFIYHFCLQYIQYRKSLRTK